MRQLILFNEWEGESRRRRPHPHRLALRWPSRHGLPVAPTGDLAYERYGLGPIQDIPRSARALARLAGQLGYEIEER